MIFNDGYQRSGSQKPGVEVSAILPAGGYTGTE